jgi:hypothetical protein
MRKRLITPTPESIRTHGEGWLDVERAALVEITSEDVGFPIEAVPKENPRFTSRSPFREITVPA